MNLNICLVNEEGSIKVLEVVEVENWDDYKYAHVQAQDYREELVGEEIKVMTDEEISVLNCKYTVLMISRFAKNGITWWIDTLASEVSEQEAISTMHIKMALTAQLRRFTVQEVGHHKVTLSGNTGIADSLFDFIAVPVGEAEAIIKAFNESLV